MNKPWSFPFTPGRSGSGGWEGGGNCKLGRSAGTIARVCHHRKIPRHVNAGDEDRFDLVAIFLVPCKRYPGVIVAFCVFFKGCFEINIRLKGAALGNQCRFWFLGEFKREADAGFYRSEKIIKRTVEMRFNEPHEVAEIEAPVSALDFLTALVPMQPGDLGSPSMIRPTSNGSNVSGTSWPS